MTVPDTVSDTAAALPVWLQVQLIDSEIRRLWSVIRGKPESTLAARYRHDLDRQLDRRHILQQLTGGTPR